MTQESPISDSQCSSQPVSGFSVIFLNLMLTQQMNEMSFKEKFFLQMLLFKPLIDLVKKSYCVKLLF
jgi:hypothetical protein